jgi:hypothetical protein
MDDLRTGDVTDSLARSAARSKCGLSALGRTAVLAPKGPRQGVKLSVTFFQIVEFELPVTTKAKVRSQNCGAAARIKQSVSLLDPDRI